MSKTQENQVNDRSLFVGQPLSGAAKFKPMEICEAVKKFREKTYIVLDQNKHTVGISLDNPAEHLASSNLELLGCLPPLFPEWLGDRSFQERHLVRFPYVCGEMANGIASAELVIAAAKSGLLAFFGAAGLSLERVRADIKKIQDALGDDYAWGSNLIHSPQEPSLEQRLVEFYLENGVRRVSASAFMGLSPALVQYACSGLHKKDGKTIRRNYLFAKISRPETARHFMLSAPRKILEELLAKGKLTLSEVEIASTIPLSEDITVESDSAGHTDNQVLPSILSTILELRNRLQSEFRYEVPIRVGAAGGIGSPNGAAAAFSMGAAYIMTGTVNQACVESGLSSHAKKMLESVNFGDTMMCAASDMFEQGVKLQVLKRGSMYGVRANWLYEIYKTYPSLESLPQTVLQRLEKDFFRKTIREVWSETCQFWNGRDPSQLQKAEEDPKHLMALIFRYYLGLSSKWAIDGIVERQFDYQIWCGPAQAAFNHWTQGTFLSQAQNRRVGQVAFNILEGAAQILRAGQLRTYGVPVPAEAFQYLPRRLDIDNPKISRKDQAYAH